MKQFNILSLVLILVFASSCKPKVPATKTIPHLQKRGSATQLIVDGKPFLVLGGELHNSSASSIEYMKPIWPRLKAMNLNTVLATVSWDQFEPSEGKFDYTLIDTLLSESRANNLHLIVLWFGSWKNGTSGYLPEWVKTNQKRFPRVKNRNGKSLEILSPLSAESCKADANAFAALMRHIREKDEQYRTVIMVQVENEVGMHSDSRDYSQLADDNFTKSVPAALLSYLAQNKEKLLPELRKKWSLTNFKTTGNWDEVFGPSTATDEIFMAWHYAQYINTVAKAGKAEYALPMYVNNWLVQPSDKTPGDYPSGGPVAHLHDVWRAAAPNIDLLAPDIYLPDFKGTVAKFSRSGNPLFIPEAIAGKLGAANAFYAIGNFGAIGFSPFGIDNEKNKATDPLPQAYALLAQLSHLILKYQGTDSIAAFALYDHPTDTLRMGAYKLNVSLRRNFFDPLDVAKSGYALIMMLNTHEYLLAGTDVDVTFSPAKSDSIAALVYAEDGRFEAQKWIPGRRLNGDEVQLRYDLSKAASEQLSGTGVRLPGGKHSIQKIKLYNYK